MRRSFIFFGVALVIALPSFTARAETIEEKAQACAACHGENGVPPEQSFPVPVIWGQNLGYLFFQLRDFKSGTRKNDVMSPIAEALPLEPVAQRCESSIPAQSGSGSRTSRTKRTNTKNDLASTRPLPNRQPPPQFRE